MVDREEARALAEEYLREKDGSGRIGKVLDVSEVNLGGIYHATDPPSFDDCWVAFIEKEWLGLASSVVVIIDKKSGALVGCYDLNDEG